MGLIVPRSPLWAQNANNLPSTPTIPIGTSITAGANNTDGTAVTLLPALSFDVEFLRIGYAGFLASNVDCSVLADILIDPAGGTSWSSLIDDLLVGYSTPLSTIGYAAGPTNWYEFPIWIPAGASIGAHARTAHSATVSGNIYIFAYGGNANPASWKCGQKVESIGINASASHGTSVTPGTAPSWSSWTNIGSPLSNECFALQFGIQGPQGGGGSAYANTEYWQFGPGVSLTTSMVKIHTTQEAGYTMCSGLIFANLAAGTQLQARAMADGRSVPVPVDCAIYAVQ